MEETKSIEGKETQKRIVGEVRSVGSRSLFTSDCDTMATKEEVFAQKLLAKADKLRSEIDDAYIIKKRGHKRRPMPHFRQEELSLGQTLQDRYIGHALIINHTSGRPSPRGAGASSAVIR